MRQSLKENNKEFDFIKINLASIDRIFEWATRRLPNKQFVGRIENSETVSYKSFKPEMGGLFCERIFGPINDSACPCGKYKGIRFKGLICDNCGVELTESKVRRYRMGYINLIYPISHVWYINSRPNLLALILEVESFEKTFATTYVTLSNNTKQIIKRLNYKVPLRSSICKKCGLLKPIPASIMERWDERIKRIKLATLAYFLLEDEVLLYGLHWDFFMYRRRRLSGFSDYPLKPFTKFTRSSVMEYIDSIIPPYGVGSALIEFELTKLDLPREITLTRRFILDCTEVLQRKGTIYLEQSLWFRKWEEQRFRKLLIQSIKRVRIIENLVITKADPSWLMLRILPVIPPALRPMIQLEGGKFASSDLNELYRRIIIRNDRLIELVEIRAPELVIRNEKRLIQEAVDTLIDNGKRGKIVLSANNRPLKSLSDIIKGKYGRFRQNLLGKRVDYSGRSVIVVGPTLKLNQCGLPYEMALELFQPFIIRELINQKLANNITFALDRIKKNAPLTEQVVNKVVKNHPIFINRAPTLHRLGIQAFQPIIIKGRAIKLHPLVCSAFNADFDGDQMAIHIPLSPEAQSECYTLMFAPYNFLSPANSNTVITPSQDMVLGCYYMTVTNIPNLLGSGHYFSNLEDVILAYEYGQLEIHSSIWVRHLTELSKSSKLLKKQFSSDGSFIEFYKDLQIRKDNQGAIIVQYIKTTTGRVIFNYALKKVLNSYN